MSIAKPQTLGLVDIVSAGYQALNRRPLAALIPAGVSASLWFGSPLVVGRDGDLAQRVRQVVEVFGDNPQVRQTLITYVLGWDMRVTLAWLNLVPILVPNPAKQQPMLLNDPLHLLVAFILINLMALLWSSLFLTLLSGAIQSEPFLLLLFVRRSLWVAASIVLATLIVLGAALVIGPPLMALSAFILTATPNAALPIALAWYIGCFWAYIYVGFVPEAILISHSGPLHAIFHSMKVVHHNMTGTVGLFLLNFLVAAGLGVIWYQLTSNPLGFVVAILGSAYVGSGLSAARLEFYRDQSSAWPGVTSNADPLA